MKIRYGFVSNSSSSSFVCNYYESKYLKYSSKDLNKVKTKLEIIFEAIKLLGLVRSGLNTNNSIKFSDIFKEPRKATESEITELNKDWNTNFKYNKEMFFINSASDNTIPSVLFDLIESEFTAERVHLG
jgi:hypothetical protein